MSVSPEPFWEGPTCVPAGFPEVLGQTAQLLLQDADPDTLCQAVCQTLREPFGVDVYFHYLVSEDGTHLELASSDGSPKVREALGSRLEFGAAVCGTVARQCSPLYVTGVETRDDAMTALIREHGVRCYACYPLLLRHKLLGTLSFGSTRRAEFTPDELDLFETISKQVTLATDRRAQSERIRELERLATAGRMSATLAHEINNPLESLSSLLYLLENEVHSEQASSLLQQAEEQVAQLAKTAQNTLELFRGGPQSAKTLDVGELAEELVSGLHLPGHVRVVSEIEADLCVKAIGGELRQVMFNLLMNAAQFTRPGTPVTLTVRRVGENAEIRVHDEGPGIPTETRGKVFQPFFTTKGKQGTGVGLWVSKEMVERVGGRLSFESDPKARPGADFIVTLPLAT